ncbi:MAG: hypothetical protein ACLTTJ_14310 [Blautia sp.]
MVSEDSRQLVEEHLKECAAWLAKCWMR